jgi:hypothetical protein
MRDGENSTMALNNDKTEPYDPGETIIQPELPADDRGFSRGVCDDYKSGEVFCEEALEYAFRRVEEHTSLIEKYGNDLVADAVRHKLMTTET